MNSSPPFAPSPLKRILETVRDAVCPVIALVLIDIVLIGLGVILAFVTFKMIEAFELPPIAYYCLVALEALMFAAYCFEIGITLAAKFGTPLGRAAKYVQHAYYLLRRGNRRHRDSSVKKGRHTKPPLNVQFKPAKVQKRHHR